MANNCRDPLPPEPAPPPSSSVPLPPLTAVTVQSMPSKSAAKLPELKVQRRCDLCQISVTSEIVLQTHLLGKPHQKKLRQAEIQANSRNDSDTASKPPLGFASVPASSSTSNSLICDVCKITMNSIQQLDVHLNGSKHKKVVAKMEKRIENYNASTNGSTWKSPADLPPSIIVSTDMKTGETPGRYKCKSCDCYLNSDNQVRKHIASERHQNMELGIPCASREDRRFQPYSGPAKFAQKLSNSANASSWKARQKSYDAQQMQPLSHFFKKGQGMM